MEIQEIQEEIEKIKKRQLGRLMGELKSVNTPQIIKDAVEKYWNFCYLDILDCVNKGNYGNSHQKK